MRKKFDATVFSAQIPVLEWKWAASWHKVWLKLPSSPKCWCRVWNVILKQRLSASIVITFPPSMNNVTFHFLSNILSTISNFQQCLLKNSLEIVLNSFPFGHTQIVSASSRYQGLQGKHFQGYQNVFEAGNITGCGAPGPRIDNAWLMPGYPKLEGAGW